MEEVQNTDVEQAIVQPETVAPQTDSQHEEVQQSNDQPEEKGWITRLRRERDEAVRAKRVQDELLQRVMTQQNQIQPQPQAQVEEDVLGDIAKEEFVPGEKVAKAYKSLERKFEAKLQEVEKKYAHQAINSRFQELERKYPDLREVVTRENLEILAQNDPHIGAVLDGKDDYSIYVLAYPIIKSSGILDQKNSDNQSKEVDRKIAQNKKSVPSPQSFDKRPIAQAFSYERMSPDLKKSLRQEMMGAAGRSSGVPLLTS